MPSKLQLERIAQGMCKLCPTPRGDDGTNQLCAAHAKSERKRIKVAVARRRQLNRRRRRCTECGLKLRLSEASVCDDCLYVQAVRNRAHRRPRLTLGDA